jgi:transcriptional regulator with XRE-family HTH domain
MKVNKETAFASYLRQQRQRRGIDLARLAGTSRLPIERLVALESGSSLPASGDLKRLAKALDIPTETIFAKAGRF